MAALDELERAGGRQRDAVLLRLDLPGDPDPHGRADDTGSATMGQWTSAVSLVTLGVRDLARARAFYEALGWRTGAQPDDDTVFFQTGCMIVGLWDRGCSPRTAAPMTREAGAGSRSRTTSPVQPRSTR